VDALRIRGVGRVDVLVTPEGSPQVLEVNVSPGMTETSLLPMAAEASGIAFAMLCDDIIRGSDDAA
jgi:D-alanine-D-alanine ligase